MTKNEAIVTVRELDRQYDEKGKEARFWAKEYRLAGTASKYVKASQKPVIESRYEKALADQDLIWKQMSDLMTKFKIELEDL